MTDESFTPQTTNDGTHKSCPHKKYGWLVLLFVVGAVLIAFRFCPFYPQFIGQQASGNTPDLAAIDQRLTGLENSVRSLDERVSALTTVTVDKETPSTEVNKPNPQTASDIAKLQNDLAALSGNIGALQNQIKDSTAHAQHTQQAAQDAVGLAVSYVQLQAATATNAAFSDEITTARKAAANDSTAQNILAKLEPYATAGAPTSYELREAFIAQESQARNARNQQQAQNFWQRWLVELKSLISIRNLHDNTIDSFVSIENDLAANKIADALRDFAQLPNEAQDVLKDWKAKAEARLAINQTMREFAAHITSLPTTTNTTTSDQPAPKE